MTDTEAVARSYFDELINKHNLDYIPTLFDPGISFHNRKCRPPAFELESRE